jgi:hypothetical protein
LGERYYTRSRRQRNTGIAAGWMRAAEKAFALFSERCYNGWCRGE